MEAKRFFLFSGQGAQYVGMGRYLYEGFGEARAVFDEADRVLGYDLSRLIIEGPADRLSETEVTQPAILTVSLATLAVLRAAGLRPHAAAGLSLGEYSALVAADALAQPEAFPLVRDRGRYMQEAVPLGTGGMLAVLGLDAQAVDAICRKMESGVVEPANFNCPGQVVVAGDIRGLEAFRHAAAAAGARRVVPLEVSAPFHSSLLSPASKRLEERLRSVALETPSIPVWANVTGRKVADVPEIRRALIDQVSHAVRFEDIIRDALSQEAYAFYEIGPGKVLSGFVRKIDRSVTTYHTDTREGLEAILAQG